MNFYQANIVFETMPTIDGTMKQDIPVSKRLNISQRETNPSSISTEYQNADLPFTAANQQPKTSSDIVNFSAQNTLNVSNKSIKFKTIPTISRPLETKKLITIKTPDFTATAVSELATAEEVRYRETLTPTPKPEVKHDFRPRNQLGRVKFEPNKSSTLNYPLTSHSSDKNTTKLGMATSAKLKFNRELTSQLHLPDNVRFSTKKMSKQSQADNSFLSLNPSVKTYQAHEQCNLILRRAKKSEINIRKIQNQINSRSITISDILTHRSLHKPNEVSISGLLAYDFTVPSHNLRKTSDDIRLLLTNHNIQSHTEGLVCGSN